MENFGNLFHFFFLFHSPSFHSFHIEKTRFHFSPFSNPPFSHDFVPFFGEDKPKTRLFPRFNGPYYYYYFLKVLSIRFSV